VTGARTSWYHAGITDWISPKSQQWYMALIRGDALKSWCARGDLNPHVLADTGT
jgi:hypothetical protein